MSDYPERLDQLSPAKQALLRARLERQEEILQNRQTIPTRGDCNTLPLSFAQERIWVHQQLVPDSVAYNRPANIRLLGPLDADALAHALSEIVKRHESL